MRCQRVLVSASIGLVMLTRALFAENAPAQPPPPNTPELAAKAAEAAKGLPAEFENTRPLLFIPMLSAPKALTGDMKDPVWQEAALFSMISLVKGELVPAKFPTTVRCFCTQEALYFGVRCEDPDPKNLTVSNGNAWENDSIEFFLYPGESCAGGKLYYQVCIDAAKKIQPLCLHLYPKHGYRGLRAPWNPQIDCELAKDDTGWGIEFKIKFADLNLTDLARNKKTLWRMDIFRNRKARGGVEDQSCAWIPTDASGFYHLPPRYGYILPAAYTTPELIADVISRAKAAAAPAEPPSEEAVRQIKELIARLGNDDYNVRKNATGRLAAMAEEKRTLVPAIQTMLKQTLTETEDSEVKLRSIKVLRTCYALSNPDDDVPPENAGY